MLNPPPVSDLLDELKQFGIFIGRLRTEASPDWWWRPVADEWSLTEVVCHLRDVESEVHQPRIDAMLNDHEPFLPGVESDTWADERGYQQQDGAAAAEAFVRAREATLAMLSDLPDDAWERRGQHTFFGPTSLHELVNLAVQHDRLHEQQIRRLLVHAA